MPVRGTGSLLPDYLAAAKLIAAVLSNTTETAVGDMVVSALEHLSGAHLAALALIRDLQLHGAGREDESVLPSELTGFGDENVTEAVFQGLTAAGMLSSQRGYGGASRFSVSKLGFLVLDVIDNPQTHGSSHTDEHPPRA